MVFLKEWRIMMKNNLTKGLIVQFVLLILLIIFMILSLFRNVFLPYADFIAGLTFIVMAYNKRKDYSKFVTVLLILFGVLFIGLGVFNIING